MRNRLKKFAWLLAGSYDDFSLENRMFNIICAVALIALSVALPVNFLLGYPIVAQLFTAFLMTLQVYLYYLARFKKRFYISRIVFAIMSYVFLSVNYFLNSGIEGPTLLAFFLTYVFLVAIFSRNSYWIWTVLHITVALALLTIDYYFPQWVRYSYTDETSKCIDITITYVLMLFFSYVALSFIKSNYETEKASSTEKTIEIEEQNKVLAKVNEEKNKLFSIVSHDLRSPLNTIQSYLELLSFDILEEKERNVAEKELVSLTKNTSDLLSNLLSWSKTQMEGVNAKLKQHNLFNVLASTINTQHAIASQKDISFSNNIDKEAVAVCDEDMLQLVVRNLLNNAIKFTPSFGKITMYSKQDAERITICVSDSGKGIPEEQQKEIFSLKIQSTYGTNKEKGIGLGLVLCKEYIELQNGRIWFDSKPDVQTNFYLSLPVA